ncbi:MAG: DUF4292 domain-containing protein [Chitinophagaceae bacterium]|nr:MAG: DUF4292 domain-containing protein [Chitinophagaceae bacterium]
MDTRCRTQREPTPGRWFRLHRKSIRTMKRLLLIVFIAAIAASCRPTKKIGVALSKKDTTQAVVAAANGKEDSLAYIRRALDGVHARHISFNTFTAKINVDYKDATNKNQNLNVNVRMFKDSAIWISATGFMGIEGMRALITKDSVKILNKLDKIYTARSMAYLQEVTDMPLDLPTMQNLLVGNPIFFDSVSSYAHASGGLTLQSVGSWFKHLLALSEDDGSILRSKIDDVDPTSNRTADITYSDYEDKGGIKFATKRQIILSEAKKLSVKMDFRQYAFNEEVSFPFSIPKNYKRQ